MYRRKDIRRVCVHLIATESGETAAVPACIYIYTNRLYIYSLTKFYLYKFDLNIFNIV